MNPKTLTLRRRGSTALALVCAVAIGPADAVAYARMTTMQPGARTPLQAEQQPYPSQDVAARIPADQLDSLVAPIALYPDPLLAQTLAASTYPMEIIQLQQWLARNPGLKGEALATAVANQPWDPSVQAMAALPDVVTRLSSDIQWTTDLGNAFLAQESEVMDAVQRMRQKARNTGALTSSTRQVVETRVVENHPVIVIEQADPEEVYVPWYNPTAVYGYPAYPYPSVYYPSGSYWTGAALAFGTGVALGSFWGHGGWGWNTGWGWGHNHINVNRNANFVRNSSFYRGGFANNRWRHNVAHRGAAPYANRAMAARYGGAYRGQPLGNRAAAARQQINRQGGNLGSTRAGALRSGAVGTAGRNFAGQRGTFNRGDRAVGTAGTLNRPGSLNRGNFNNRNFNRGNFNNRNFNRGNFNNRNFNRGNFSNRSFNRGNFNSGSFNRRDFGSRSFNRGNFGGRSFNRGSFGGGRSFRGGNRGGFGGGGRRGGFGGGGGRRGGGRR